MKNLLERLTPENLAKLQDQDKEYPHAIKALIEELQNSTSVLDLTYGSAVAMSNFLGLPNYTITELLNLFES
jgi:hypothetical protein